MTEKRTAMTVRLTDREYTEIMKHLVDLRMSFNEYVRLLLNIDTRLQDEIYRIGEIPRFKYSQPVQEALQLLLCWVSEEMIPSASSDE